MLQEVSKEGPGVHHETPFLIRGSKEGEELPDRRGIRLLHGKDNPRGKTFQPDWSFPFVAHRLNKTKDGRGGVENAPQGG